MISFDFTALEWNTNQTMRRRSAVSNYQSHFCLSLQAVWNRTSCFFLHNKKQMSNLSLFKTLQGKLSIRLPHPEQLPPPTSLAGLCSELSKTPLSEVWPALWVDIFILLPLAWTKGLLCFQKDWGFADGRRFLKVKKQSHLVSPCAASL